MRSEKTPAQPDELEMWIPPPVMPERRLLRSPPVGGNVWPGQSCPRFRARSSETLKIGQECWFCQFADFHLTERRALDVGICCYKG